MTVTPRPIYHADGRKSPDAYIRPPALHDELTGRFGEFPCSPTGDRPPRSRRRPGSWTRPGTSCARTRPS
ncbi:hypothetical protein NKG05_17795 [Oerskovia sp. M15]